MAAAPVRSIRFGALLRQADNPWSSIVEAARICDDLGFHSIYFIERLLAIPDPPRTSSGRGRECLLGDAL